MKHVYPVGQPNSKGKHKQGQRFNTKYRLSASQVRKIRYLYAAHLKTVTALALQFHVTKTTIADIVNGNTWKWL